MSPSGAASPIGFDLWQRNSNGISHIDSDAGSDTKSSAEDTTTTPTQRCYNHQEPFKSSVFLFNHPSSNYAYKNNERKPVWQY